jgi:hypothetical protein
MRGTCRKTVEIRIWAQDQILSPRHCIFSMKCGLSTMHNVLNDFRPCCVWVWGTLGTKNVRRDIVDTYFHASRFPGTTQPNKHGFLLHEGKAERAFRADEFRLVSDVWLIMATTFVMLFEVDREDSLSSRPQTGGTTGWSWTELWMRLSIRLNWLGIGSGQAILGAVSDSSLGLSKSSILRCLQRGRMWITCW